MLTARRVWWRECLEAEVSLTGGSFAPNLLDATVAIAKWGMPLVVRSKLAENSVVDF